ncbi:MAG TPA: membrane protein insertion efficiency factor YidD [Candidatus Omnitrophota bacterium]|nr:membrane protein insertion efficiency factor YidD [Candidatus Omnitrophota bacterium]
MKTLIRSIIGFYRRLISPLLGLRCRFEPPCSVYFLRAVETNGVIKGTAQGFWRILRCNPFSAGGWDPVTRPGEDIRAGGRPEKGSRQ